MSRRGWFRIALLLGGAMIGGLAPSVAQETAPPAPAPPPVTAPALTTTSPPGLVPGAPAGEAMAPAVTEPGVPLLPPEVQVVRFHGPEGIKVDVLGPPPEPIPSGDGRGLATFGLRVGTAYRLSLSNLPNRAPGVKLYPVVEMVGHLHRPPGIDPLKFPIRIIIREEDIDDVLDGGKLVTHVVYLEDPEQALPVNLPKDDIPTAMLGPAENPLKVGAALGRVVAIVRVGGRTPSLEEEAMTGAPGYGPALGRCPFVGPTGGPCALPCGPVRGTPPPAGRPWMPKDEFLCDGGDFGVPVHFAGDGGLAGIDPRDAVIRFHDTKRPRLLPTNVVCIYAPRFASVRTSVGLDQHVALVVPAGLERLQRQEMSAAVAGPKRLIRNQAPELNRGRTRASGLINRQFAGTNIEVRVLAGVTDIRHIAGNILTQGPEVARNRQVPAFTRLKIGPEAIKTAETAVVTGVVQGVGETVMAWKPQELVGLETPPNMPGLAVVKRVSAGEAEPGDVVTFVIQFRNMGNVAISSVSVIDSLLPRLEYVVGSAKGPAGTVFTAGENKAGSTELRWDLPGSLAPGAEGIVTFDAKVR